MAGVRAAGLKKCCIHLVFVCKTVKSTNYSCRGAFCSQVYSLWASNAAGPLICISSLIRLIGQVSPTPTSPLHFCFYCNIKTDPPPPSPLKRTPSFCGAGTYFSSCLRPTGHWSLIYEVEGSRSVAASYIMIKIPSVETAVALVVHIFLYVTSCQTVSQCAAAPVTHH